MRVLHLSLGLPPFRTGGLNRYCADLLPDDFDLRKKREFPRI